MDKNFELYPDDFDDLERGRGYLLRLLVDRQPSYQAYPAVGDFEILLPRAGWTWIGHPFDHDTPLLDVSVRDNGSGITRTGWDDYQDPNGWVNWNILWWDSSVDSWKLLGFEGADDDTLHAWYGYLVWSNVDDLTLIVPDE